MHKQALHNAGRVTYGQTEEEDKWPEMTNENAKELEPILVYPKADAAAGAPRIDHEDVSLNLC